MIAGLPVKVFCTTTAVVLLWAHTFLTIPSIHGAAFGRTQRGWADGASWIPFRQNRSPISGCQRRCAESWLRWRWRWWWFHEHSLFETLRPPPAARTGRLRSQEHPRRLPRSAQAYTFHPSASDADGNTLSFQISNRPTWASFNPTSGSLTGTPASNTSAPTATSSSASAMAPPALPCRHFRFRSRHCHRTDQSAADDQRHTAHRHHCRAGLQFPAFGIRPEQRHAHFFDQQQARLGDVQHQSPGACMEHRRR